MDKQTAMKILGLSSEASAAEAKAAYRSLAKTHHPDRYAGDVRKARDAENRMKEINGAFKFISPHLADRPPDKTVTKPSSTSSVSDFFSNVSRHFRAGTARAGKRNAPSRNKSTAPKKVRKQKPRPAKPVFNAFLKNAAPEMPHDSPNLVPGKPSGRPAVDAYQNYRRYMALKKKVQAQRRRSKNMGIGRVESISPVQRVKPVGED